LWEARHDPIYRRRRLLHSALFLAATAGFADAGTVLADEADRAMLRAARSDGMTQRFVLASISTTHALIVTALALPPGLWNTLRVGAVTSVVAWFAIVVCGVVLASS